MNLKNKAMEFKIVTIKNEVPIDKQSLNRICDINMVFETDYYNDVISISRNGGLKFNFKTKSSWIGLSKINDYSIHNVGKMNVMIFNTEYDKIKVLRIFAEFYKEIIEQKIHNLNVDLKMWNDVLSDTAS